MMFCLSLKRLVSLVDQAFQRDERSTLDIVTRCLPASVQLAVDNCACSATSEGNVAPTRLTVQCRTPIADLQYQHY
jgi:hypothetical protein